MVKEEVDHFKEESGECCNAAMSAPAFAWCDAVVGVLPLHASYQLAVGQRRVGGRAAAAPQLRLRLSRACAAAPPRCRPCA